MDGLLLQSRYKKPLRVVRPDEEGLDLKHKFVLIIALNGQGIKQGYYFRHGGGA